MNLETEIIDVICVAESKSFGLLALQMYSTESDPHNARCTLQRLTQSNGTTQSNTLLSANCRLDTLWISPEGNIWLGGIDGDVITTASIKLPSTSNNLIVDTYDNSITWAKGQVFKRGMLNAIYGTSDNDVWITTFSGAVLHWNGNRWNEYQLTKAPTAIDGSGENDIYVVGYEGNIHHWDGVNWSKIQLPSNIRLNEPFTDVCVVDHRNVYITGRGGVFLVGNHQSGFVNLSTSEYAWYGVDYIEKRILLAGGPKGIFEFKDNKFICLKDKGHPVGAHRTKSAVNFIPAEQNDNPWFIRYTPGKSREWAQIKT